MVPANYKAFCAGFLVLRLRGARNVLKKTHFGCILIISCSPTHHAVPPPLTGRPNKDSANMSDFIATAPATGCAAVSAGPADCSLAELPVGQTGTVLSMRPGLRGRKKFADVGIVPGTDLVMEAHAPFGGLLRIKIMETSISIHRDDAANILIRRRTA